jgi:hypothetical protein
MCLVIGALVAYLLVKSTTPCHRPPVLGRVFGWAVWHLNERGFAVHKPEPQKVPNEYPVVGSNISLERAVSAPRAVPAVPLLGCTSVPSTNGRSCGRSIQSLDANMVASALRILGALLIFFGVSFASVGLVDFRTPISRSEAMATWQSELVRVHSEFGYYCVARIRCRRGIVV